MLKFSFWGKIVEIVLFFLGRLNEQPQNRNEEPTLARETNNETQQMANGLIKSNFTKNGNLTNMAHPVNSHILNGTIEVRAESKPCISSWKLNGQTFHFCSKFAVEGTCLCAVEIESKTRELTHWRKCETNLCLNWTNKFDLNLVTSQSFVTILFDKINSDLDSRFRQATLQFAQPVLFDLAFRSRLTGKSFKIHNKLSVKDRAAYDLSSFNVAHPSENHHNSKNKYFLGLMFNLGKTVPAKQLNETKLSNYV